MGKMNKRRMLLLSPLLFGFSLMSFRCADDPGASVKKFYTDYATHEEEMIDAKKLNLELQAESSVLMKNKNNVLPFDARVHNVTVFGHAGYDYRSGGGGSGSSGTDADATVLNALENAGLHVNPKVMALNKDWADNHAVVSGSGFFASKSVSEMPTSFLAPAEGSYAMYHDAAVIMISRPGSEFSDNKAYDVAGHSNKLDHILMLEDNEIEMIKYVRRTQKFDKVVLVVNSASAMELDPVINGELKDDVDSVLWIGFTGQNGILALGDVLKGNVEPSGRTVDIYPKDFKKDPTWNNFSDGTQVGAKVENGKVVTTDKTTVLGPDGSAYKHWNSKIDSDGNSLNDGSAYTEVSYEEGIYMGYRYYETRGAVEGGTWYEDNVVFPFGYGLSYTDFSYEMVGSAGGAITDVDQKIELKVKVTNTGTRAGKDVVQMYYKSTYTTGGIEKAEKNLGDFAKTKLLNPGESEVLTLTMKARDMADFDYNDANGNGFKGYELEAGDYEVMLQKNSHELLSKTSKATFHIDTVAGDTATHGHTGLKVTKSDKTGKDIVARFSDGDLTDTSKVGVTEADKTAKKGITFMTRADFAGTFPTAPTAADLTYSQAALDFLDGQSADYAYEDKETDPWYKTTADVAGWSQLSADEAAAKPTAADRGVDLNTMVGKDINDPAWVAIMNQLSYEEMCKYLQGNSRKMNALPGVGKLLEVDNDGPAQLKGGSKGSGVAWVSEVNIASTYNKELAYEQGLMVGNDGLFVGVNGWYGPAADTHRSPLSGRNFEYYSQDGVQGGKIAAEVIRGAQSKGIHTYLKHFALNDQEMNRTTSGGLITYCNEQAMRQIYLKAFELCFTEADCNGTMSAFNRIGMNKSVNFALYNGILQDEWGFKGVSDSDIGGNVQTGYDFARCNGYPMGTNNKAGNEFEGVYDKATNMVYVAKDATEYANKAHTLASPTQWYWIRNTVQRSLWTYCNTSAIQNGIKVDSLVGKEFTGMVGEAINEDLKFDAALVNNALEQKYELVSGKLPDGIKFDSGKLTGTPTTSGVYQFQVKATFDGWIEKTLSYKITVASAFALNKTSGKVGEAFNGAIETEIQGLNNTKYTIADGQLPAGLTLAEDGTITGTPTEAGDFTFTVNYYGEQGSGWFMSRYNYKETFTISVDAAGGSVVEPEDPNKALKEEIEAAKKEAEEASKKIEELEAAIEELKNAKSEGGCAGSIVTASSIVAALALGACGLALKKRKEDK